jgi:hypothetical protein
MERPDTGVGNVSTTAKKYGCYKGSGSIRGRISGRIVGWQRMLSRLGNLRKLESGMLYKKE